MLVVTQVKMKLALVCVVVVLLVCSMLLDSAQGRFGGHGEGGGGPYFRRLGGSSRARRSVNRPPGVGRK